MRRDLDELGRISVGCGHEGARVDRLARGSRTVQLGRCWRLVTAPSRSPANPATNFWLAWKTEKKMRRENLSRQTARSFLDPSGERVFTYDKIHLVPFGEYVPLRRWLTFAGKLTADIGDFTPGTPIEWAGCRAEHSARSSATRRFSRTKCGDLRRTVRSC